jgi:hypothetical protein
MSLADALSALPTAGVLAFVVILMLRGDLVPKKNYNAVTAAMKESHKAVVARCSDELAKAEQRESEWRVLAMDAMNVTEAAVGRAKGAG